MWRQQDQHRVRILELDRPEAKNAFSTQVMRGLVRLLNEAEADPHVRVLVITGKQECFSSGADLSILSDPTNPQNYKALKVDTPELVDTLIAFSKPLLMAVNGVGVGFGATMLGLADVVVMASSARIRVPFSRLAITPEGASTVAFTQLVGYQRAFWFLASAEWMTAQECLEAGIALAVVDDDQLMEATLERAMLLARFPVHTLIETKRLLRKPINEQLLQANRDEIECLLALLEHPAAIEGVAAVRQRREPNFEGY